MEASAALAGVRALADVIATDLGHRPKPLWCTEWQRTLEEPPSRFEPNLASLAPTIRDLHSEHTLDGDCFWRLLVTPAYLRRPRARGRVNGLFHADGSVYSRADAEAIAGRELDVEMRRELPTGLASHPFPYPGAVERDPESATGSVRPSRAPSTLLDRLADVLGL